MAATFLLLLTLLLPLGLARTDDNSAMTDASALLLLKSSFTNASALSSWSVPAKGDANPCNPKSPWIGLVCSDGIVTGLRLSDSGLGGTLDVAALTHFRALRSISFSRNALSGPIPSLGRLDALKAIYLEDNHFSGDIPDDLFARMDHLKKLWLSGNAFTGTIPSSLAKATSLIELHLDRNQFSGPVPALPLPALASFNVSHNALTGTVPDILSAKFNASCFDGNPGLCGQPLPACGGALAAAALPLPRKGIAGWTAGVCVLIVVLVCAVVVFLAAVRRRREGAGFETLGVETGEAEDGEALMDSASSYSGGHSRKPSSTKHRRTGSSLRGAGSHRGGGRGAAAGGELVLVNESKGQFGLPDLMRAAAEVLGSGGLGSAYKAVMSNGVAVAVKRMKEMNKVGKEMFDVEMRRLGRLNHPNVLPPLAYHYRKEEKLLVFEYVPKGSLLYVLHGDRGPDHAALDWPTRLKILRGVAAGMVFLHAELNSLDIPHGNLKSGNVLLADDFTPLLVDYGFISLINPSHASETMFAYKSPESLHHRHVSPKSDVYCLGILILELLTGRFPSQYLNNTKGGTDVVQWAASAIEDGRVPDLLDPQITMGNKGALPDMERLLRVGMAFVEQDPERRPGMKEAAARVEEVAAALSKAPSLKDDGSGNMQWRTKSIGERSARRNEDGFSFAIS